MRPYQCWWQWKNHFLWLVWYTPVNTSLYTNWFLETIPYRWLNWAIQYNFSSQIFFFFNSLLSQPGKFLLSMYLRASPHCTMQYHVERYLRQLINKLSQLLETAKLWQAGALQRLISCAGYNVNVSYASEFFCSNQKNLQGYIRPTFITGKTSMGRKNPHPKCFH